MFQSDETGPVRQGGGDHSGAASGGELLPASTWRPLAVMAEQAEPTAVDDPAFLRRLRARLALSPDTRLVVLPELHFHASRAVPAELAEPIPGPLTERLARLARELGIWLVPGSLFELAPSGAVFNTAVAISPEGEIVASYRKCFPWRPYETTEPGTQFVVFDIPESGRVGLSICYDLWFPEVARHLAWMGAEVILQVTSTYTADRQQELVLAQATAITNQVFVVNVNAAAPFGAGRSLIVDPEGRVRVEAGESPNTLVDVIDLAEVGRVRERGTAGIDRVWLQFRPGDPELPLPLYGGRIDPLTWTPRSVSRQQSLREPLALTELDGQSRSAQEPYDVQHQPITIHQGET